MKTQITKRLTAFISITLFSCFTSFLFAQSCNSVKPCPAGYSCVNGLCTKTLYFCNCRIHGYGCKNNHACINFCSLRCDFFANRESTNESTLASIYHHDSLLTDKVFENGQYDFQWNNSETKSGIYVLQYETNSLGEVQKLATLK